MTDDKFKSLLEEVLELEKQWHDIVMDCISVMIDKLNEKTQKIWGKE